MGLATAALRGFGRAALRLRYKIRLHGLAEVASRGRGGVLFLPNHPALIDPVIMTTELNRLFRPLALADAAQTDKPVVRSLARRFRVHSFPDPSSHGESVRKEVEAALDSAAGELEAGGNVLLYPAGRIYRSKEEDLGGNSAVETLLQKVPRSRVVLVRTVGLWGSLFSRARGSPPDFGRNMRTAVRWAFGNAILFSPRRPVDIYFQEMPILPEPGGRGVLNRKLEEYYNEGAQPNTYVPYYFWEKGSARVVPEPASRRVSGDARDVPEATRRQVLRKLADMCGVSEVREGSHLSRDLGMDSLSRAELQVWLEAEFGHPPGDAESLETAADAVLAAAGQGTSLAVEAPPKAPKAWLKRAGKGPFTLPGGDTVTEVFVRQAARGYDRVVLADGSRGARTYRDILTGVFALRERIRPMPGDCVGIMLPASVAADTVYLATLFSGKTPVMVNWTTGARAIRHGLELLGIRRVLTSSLLLEKLRAQGLDLSELKDSLVPLEGLSKEISAFDKVRAALNARLRPGSLLATPPSETAVVLFTSGSESMPKAVPLTHANFLSNIRDLLSVITFEPGERIMGVLPPFHSFGIMATTILPLLSGLPVVHHPNPTEGNRIAALVEAFGATLLPGTPTFLGGIVRAASDAQLASLHMVLTGAEKCPERLYETLRARFPGLLVLEGYGVTECSPIISFNRQDAPVPQSIGRVLPSMEYALVGPDSGTRVRPGEPGLLVVRGPNVFGGYMNYQGPSPFVRFEGKDWYRTGDLVSESSDGVLTFRGRLKRFVKLGGEMISLPAIEEALAARYSVEGDDRPAVAVVGTPDECNPELVLFCVAPIGREEANRVIREAGLSALHSVRLVRTVPEIPLLGTGKTDYRALQGMLSAQP